MRLLILVLIGLTAVVSSTEVLREKRQSPGLQHYGSFVNDPWKNTEDLGTLLAGRQQQQQYQRPRQRFQTRSGDNLQPRPKQDGAFDIQRHYVARLQAPPPPPPIRRAPPPPPIRRAPPPPPPRPRNSWITTYAATSASSTTTEVPPFVLLTSSPAPPPRPTTSYTTRSPTLQTRSGGQTYRPRRITDYPPLSRLSLGQGQEEVSARVVNLANNQQRQRSSYPQQRQESYPWRVTSEQGRPVQRQQQRTSGLQLRSGDTVAYRNNQGEETQWTRYRQQEPDRSTHTGLDITHSYRPHARDNGQKYPYPMLLDRETAEKTAREGVRVNGNLYDCKDEELPYFPGNNVIKTICNRVKNENDS